MRSITSRSLAAIALVCLSAQAFAEDLTIRTSDPTFVVVVPGMPQVPLGPHPAAAQNPAARLMGSTSDGFTISALVPKAEGASAQQCASWLAGSTLSRFAPDLASIRLAAAGPNAWVLVYPFKAGGMEQLKAHVFSGNGKGQCIEIHMSRLGATAKQREEWLAGFQGISVIAE